MAEEAEMAPNTTSEPAEQAPGTATPSEEQTPPLDDTETLEHAPAIETSASEDTPTPPEETTEPNDPESSAPAATPAPTEEEEEDDNTFAHRVNGEGNYTMLDLLVALFCIMEGKPIPGDLQQRLNSNLSNSDFINNPEFVASLPDGYEIGPDGITVDMIDEMIADGQQDELYEAAARTAINSGIEAYVEDALNRGVHYQMGAKGGGSALDCSGLVAKALETGQTLLAKGITIHGSDANADLQLSNNFAGAAQTHSDGQVYNFGQESGILRGSDVRIENLRAGMVIGLDTGHRAHESAGRNLGIDHVGIVYRDTETGKLMFAESSSSANGIRIRPLEEFLSTTQATLYASDPVQAAVNNMQVALEANEPASTPEEIVEKSEPAATPEGEQPESETSQTASTLEALSSPS